MDFVAANLHVVVTEVRHRFELRVYTLPSCPVNRRRHDPNEHRARSSLQGSDRNGDLSLRLVGLVANRLGLLNKRFSLFLDCSDFASREINLFP